MKLYLLWRTS